MYGSALSSIIISGKCDPEATARCRFFLFLRTASTMKKMTTSTAIPTPTPIPASAPVDRPCNESFREVELLLAAGGLEAADIGWVEDEAPLVYSCYYSNATVTCLNSSYLP